MLVQGTKICAHIYLVLKRMISKLEHITTSSNFSMLKFNFGLGGRGEMITEAENNAPS